MGVIWSDGDDATAMETEDFHRDDGERSGESEKRPHHFRRQKMQLSLIFDFER